MQGGTMSQADEPDLNALKRLLHRLEKVDATDAAVTAPRPMPQGPVAQAEAVTAPPTVEPKSGLSEMRRGPVGSDSRPGSGLPKPEPQIPLPPVPPSSTKAPPLPSVAAEVAHRSTGAQPGTGAPTVAAGRRRSGRFRIVFTIALTTAISTALTVLVFKRVIAPYLATSAEHAEGEPASPRLTTSLPASDDMQASARFSAPATSTPAAQSEPALPSPSEPTPAGPAVQREAGIPSEATLKAEQAQERPVAAQPATEELPAGKSDASEAVVGDSRSAAASDLVDVARPAAQSLPRAEGEGASGAPLSAPDRNAVAPVADRGMLSTPGSWVVSPGARHRLPFALSGAAAEDGKAYQIIVSGLESDAVVRNAIEVVAGVWLIDSRQLASVELERGAVPPTALSVTVVLRNADGKEIERRVMRLLAQSD